ncbi:DNA-binding protein, excisionase family [Mycobacteroides abscessus subsp. massiliense]|uniref:helix-turn-helix domain-containing protein n=1 Tax=Mycobacteroides abscessus TaxID=36809 RepID=UPI0009C8EF70|nr:helix-turn-helix domain-containing protein [Mycobacteroides abscessus]SLH95782.1 DNA-binding protein, excisionase family [Mycobacteroides abscessus subsp. massiliense]SLI84040.1 DNA-binding protein, excisionase family [Mycobacteroides abscessus subsp. massiliense]
MSCCCQRHNCARTPARHRVGVFLLPTKEPGVIVAQRISVNEVAEEFGISPRTVRRYIATGRLTAYRVGPKLVRLDPDQVRKQLLGDSKT